MSYRLVTKLVLSRVPVIISHSTSRMEPLANLSTAPILDSFDLTIGTGEGDGDEGDGLHCIFEGGALKLSHVRIDGTYFAFPLLTRFASVTTLHLRDMPNYTDGPLSTCLLRFCLTPTSLKTLTRRC